MKTLLFSMIVSMTVTSPAFGQELASNFDQLRVLVKAGDRLAVTNAEGVVTRGRLVAIKGTSLELGGSDLTTVNEATVTRIRWTHADTLANGAKIGASVGLIWGVLGAIALSGEFGVSGAVALVGSYTALGAGVGVGVDALHEATDTIFSRPPARLGRASIAPFAADRGRGLRVALRF
jgi:hypothetical protein